MKVFLFLVLVLSIVLGMATASAVPGDFTEDGEFGNTNPGKFDSSLTGDVNKDGKMNPKTCCG